MSETDGKLPLPDLESSDGMMPPDTGALAPEPESADHSAADLEAVFDVPVKVSAVLGRARMEVGDLLKLGPGAVLELDRKVGEAIDIYVNNRLVARGEVVLVEDKLGVTMTEIIKAERQLSSVIRLCAKRKERSMRLLIVGTLKGQLTTATKLAMEQRRERHPRRVRSSRRSTCCAPAAAPTC